MATSGGAFTALRSEGVVVRIELDAGLLHLLPGLGRRDIKGRLRIEVEGRRHVEPAERALDRSLQDGHDGPVLLELGFHLGRVDVHVHPRGIDLEEEHIQRKLPRSQQALHGTHDRPVERTVPDESAVDEQELLPAGAPGEFRLAHEALQSDHIGPLLHRDEALVVFAAEDADDALAQAAGRQVEQLRAVVAQHERQVRVGQRHALEFIDAMPQLHLVALQEIPAGGHIVEQPLDRHPRPPIAGDRLRGLAFTPLHHHFDAHLLLGTAGPQFHPRDGRNAGQGLPAEAHGREREQVVRRTQFGCRMPTEAGFGIRRRHPAAVIGYNDAVAARILQLDHDAARTGIEGILHQFLDHRRRPLHHLTGGDLVGHVFGQPADHGFRRSRHGAGVIRYSRAKSVVSTQSKPRHAA